MKVLIAIIFLFAQDLVLAGWFDKDGNDDKGTQIDQEGLVNTIVEHQRTVVESARFREGKVAIIATCAIISTALQVITLVYKLYQKHVLAVARSLPK